MGFEGLGLFGVIFESKMDDVAGKDKYEYVHFHNLLSSKNIIRVRE